MTRRIIILILFLTIAAYSHTFASPPVGTIPAIGDAVTWQPSVWLVPVGGSRD